MRLKSLFHNYTLKRVCYDPLYGIGPSTPISLARVIEVVAARGRRRDVAQRLAKLLLTKAAASSGAGFLVSPQVAREGHSVQENCSRSMMNCYVHLHSPYGCSRNHFLHCKSIITSVSWV